MNKTLTLEPTAEEVPKMEAALSEIFAEIERIDERISKDQQETKWLRMETRKMLAQLQAR
jgi:regulator of replication initiation timing